MLLVETYNQQQEDEPAILELKDVDKTSRNCSRLSSLFCNAYVRILNQPTAHAP